MSTSCTPPAEAPVCSTRCCNSSGRFSICQCPACWVTLQAGHWHIENLPDELQHLVEHTGASAGGVQEVDINVAVARLAAQRLYERGYSVEVLDATVPQ